MRGMFYLIEENGDGDIRFLALPRADTRGVSLERRGSSREYIYRITVRSAGLPYEINVSDGEYIVVDDTEYKYQTIAKKIFDDLRVNLEIDVTWERKHRKWTRTEGRPT